MCRTARLCTSCLFSSTDTSSSGNDGMTSGLEGSFYQAPPSLNDTPSINNAKSEEQDNSVTSEVQASGSEVAGKDFDANQVSNNDGTTTSVTKEGGVSYGEAMEYTSNDVNAPYASGQALENIQAIESDSSSAQESEFLNAQESGEKAFNIYTERQLDDPGLRIGPPGTNAFEELQDAKRSPHTPFDSTADSIGYKRGVGVDELVAAPEYALVHPIKNDDDQFEELEELKGSLSYD